MCQAIIPRRTPPDGQHGNQLQISHIASNHPKTPRPFGNKIYPKRHPEFRRAGAGFPPLHAGAEAVLFRAGKHGTQ